MGAVSINGLWADYLLIVVDYKPLGTQTCQPSVLMRKLAHYSCSYLIKKTEMDGTFLHMSQLVRELKTLGTLVECFTQYATA